MFNTLIGEKEPCFIRVYNLEKSTGALLSQFYSSSLRCYLVVVPVLVFLVSCT